VAATFGQEEISEEFTALVQQHTEGNPFFTQEVLRALVERGDVYQENGRWTRKGVEEIEVPESVRSAVGERLSRVSERTQEVLYRGSVLGQTFAFDDLQRMGDQPEEEVEEALGEALSAGLVQMAGEEAYTFSHVLIQQAMYAELLPRRRRRLHLAAGNAIEQLPERRRETRVAELAWHFLQGGEARRALTYADQAGGQAATVFAYAEAEGQYRTAVELAQESEDVVREAALLMKLGNVLLTVDRFAEALAIFERAAERYRWLDDIEGEAQAVLMLGTAHFGQGTLQQGILRMQALAETMEGESSSPYVALLAAWGQGLRLWMSGQHHELLAVWERAAELARAVGNRRLLGAGEIFRGIALRMVGQPEEAIRVHGENAELADALRDLQLRWQALMALGEVYLLSLGDFKRALEVFESTREVAERARNQGSLAFSYAHLGSTLTYLGEWQEAREHLERAVKIVRETDESWGTAMPLLEMANLCLLEGRWDEASSYLEEGLAVAQRNDDPQWVGRARSLLAELEVRQGHPNQALDHLEFFVARPMGGDQVRMLPAVVAWTYLEIGKIDRADEVVRQGIRQPHVSHSRFLLTPWLRLQGMVLTRQHRWEEAERAFEESISVSRSLRYPHAEASALLEYGVMHSTKGDAPPARARLEEALAIFQRLGARKDIERTERVLAETG
jgi:tetratricopeptide (TPR) repeat protein